MPPQFSRNFATAALLPDGTVILAGGQANPDPQGAVNSTDIYDPSKDNASCTGGCSAWSVGPAMNVGHCHGTMTTLSNGMLLVAGGRCGPADSIAVAELYDPAAKQWSPAASLGSARGFDAAALLKDGRVLVAGGILAGGAISNTMEIYTPA